MYARLAQIKRGDQAGKKVQKVASRGTIWEEIFCCDSSTKIFFEKAKKYNYSMQHSLPSFFNYILRAILLVTILLRSHISCQNPWDLAIGYIKRNGFWS